MSLSPTVRLHLVEPVLESRTVLTPKRMSQRQLWGCERETDFFRRVIPPAAEDEWLFGVAQNRPLCLASHSGCNAANPKKALVVALGAGPDPCN